VPSSPGGIPPAITHPGRFPCPASGRGPGSKLSTSPYSTVGTKENHSSTELDKRRVKEARLPPDLCPVVEAFPYLFLLRPSRSYFFPGAGDKGSLVSTRLGFNTSWDSGEACGAQALE